MQPINISINMGNQGGGGQQFGGPMNVPHPGGRDYGPEFRNLISS